MDTEENLTGGCLLPALQALSVMALLAVLVAAATALAGWPGEKAILAGVVAGAAGGLAVWAYQVAAWRRVTYHQEDTVFYPEEDEPPRCEVSTIRLEIAEGRRLTFAELPCDEGQLRRLAAGVLQGLPMSESTWTGTGKTFSRAQFSDVRAELLRRGLIAWTSPGTPARGVQLTRPGRAAFAHLAGLQDDQEEAPYPPRPPDPRRRRF